MHFTMIGFGSCGDSPMAVDPNVTGELNFMVMLSLGWSQTYQPLSYSLIRIVAIGISIGLSELHGYVPYVNYCRAGGLQLAVAPRILCSVGFQYLLIAYLWYNRQFECNFARICSLIIYWGYPLVPMVHWAAMKTGLSACCRLSYQPLLPWLPQKNMNHLSLHAIPCATNTANFYASHCWNGIFWCSSL